MGVITHAGLGDAFPQTLKKSIALARANMMQEVTMAVSNWMQVHFVEQLAGELLAAHEQAMEVLSKENANLVVENDALRSKLEGGAPSNSPASQEPATVAVPKTEEKQQMVAKPEEKLAPPAAPRGEAGLPVTDGTEPPGGRGSDRPSTLEPVPLAKETEEAINARRFSRDDTQGSMVLDNTMKGRALKTLKTSRFAIDDEPTRVDPRNCVAQIVRSQYFEAFFCLVIGLNCFSMGVEAHFMVQEEETIFTTPIELLEHVFTGLFTIELLMRLYVFGWRVFIPDEPGHMWNFMDLSLVAVTGILFGWIIPPLAESLGVDSRGGFLRTLTVLRAVRLLRVVRVVRKVHAFREVYLLIRGLSNSMRILVWTCIVIFFVTYIFAVFGLWLIGKVVIDIYLDEATDPTLLPEIKDVLKWVGGLDRILGTLIQVLTLDSWTAKVEVVMKYAPWCWLYFYAYIAVAVFVLMNLVTAIIVENAMATSREEADHRLQEKEKQMHREMEELKTLFSLMDTDGGGTLDWSEFQQSFSNDRMRRRWNLLNFGPAECHELFDLLDNGDGEIATEEFFEGLQKMKGQAMSKDMVRLNKQLDRMSNNVATIASALGLQHGKRMSAHIPPIFHLPGECLPGEAGYQAQQLALQAAPHSHEQVQQRVVPAAAVAAPSIVV